MSIVLKQYGEWGIRLLYNKKRIMLKSAVVAMFLITVIIVSLILSCYYFVNEREEYFFNRARFLVSRQMNKINKGIYEKGRYNYVVFDIRGNVLYSDDKKYDNGKSYDLSEVLQFDKSYYNDDKQRIKHSFIIKNNDEVSGFALFFIPIADIRELSNISSVLKIFYPVIITDIIVIGAIIYGFYYYKRKIISPINDINKSSKAIMNGDYNVKVVNCDDIMQDEVHELTYNFELMRDELKNKIEEEKKMRNLHVEVISCISHDLKTPLSTIKAYGEGIRDGLATDSERQKEFAEIIVNKTGIMTKMINDLLEHSKAELHQLRIDKEKVPFKKYFLDLMYDVEMYVENKNFQFTFINELDNFNSYIDRDRITEVVFNIVENALKYNDKVEKKIIFSAFMKYEYVCISIKDNGIGISKSDINHVFDKFYRAEKSRSMQVPGSGLGLSICRYIVEQHGGTISIKSSIGKYTEVTFTLKI